MAAASPGWLALLSFAVLLVACEGGGEPTPGSGSSQSASGSGVGPAAPGRGAAGSASPRQGPVVRIATFNIQELTTAQIDDVDTAGVGQDPQARAAARVIQTVRPDVLLLNEIDHDDAHADEGLDRNARRFARHYLAAGHAPVDYPHAFAAPSNTGILSGLDLDANGVVATTALRGQEAHGNDAYGFGLYPGQYAMAILSRFPIDAEAARTFQRFLWKDLPGHHIPEGHFTDEVLGDFRLSSKSHWDVPVRIDGTTLHLLASHPTPPVFDGDEDLNGRRNFDEIGFWVRYLEDGEALVDDAGRAGGIGTSRALAGGTRDGGEEPGSRGGQHSRDGQETGESRDVPSAGAGAAAADGPLFVILGDLNARPDQDESVYDGQRAIEQLLDHPLVQDTGDVATSGGALVGHEAGPPAFKERSTAEFLEGARVDYVLPGAGLEVVDGGVFWPDPAEDPEGAAWAEAASDHRLVWVDVRLPARW